jgi:GNAT superfamily N-acetyltransferase
MDDLRLRPGTPGDHPLIARLFLELGVDEAPPDAAAFRAGLMAGTTVAERGGVAVGYAFVQVLETTGYVRHLVVDAAARGQGVGRAIMEALRQRFREAGCTRWCLNVKPDNVAARRLYERCGMELVHASRVVRFAWDLVDRLPSSAAAARELLAVDDAAFEDAFALPRGLLAASRGAGKVVLAARDEHGAAAVAAFDPTFPGAFPFRAATPALARALLEACRARAVAIDDADHPWRGQGMQVVTEAAPALADALVEAGGRDVLETLHYAGPL